MNKTNILKKIIILALILALPGFLYYLLTVQGKNRYQPLPFFGPKELAKTTHKVKGKDIPDTLYHTLSDFHLNDQDNNPVSFKTFDGKIFIATFFYTHCSTICNEVNKNISVLANGYAKNKMIDFVSITVDPQRDTAPVLKQYAEKFNAPAGKWLFLTGDTSTIYPLARNGFLVNALKVTNDDFIYSDKVILIDQNKRIRGYYSGTDPDDVTRLDNEIKVLVSEVLRSKDKAVY
jgi:protein SCO1/2